MDSKQLAFALILVGGLVIFVFSLISLAISSVPQQQAAPNVTNPLAQKLQSQLLQVTQGARILIFIAAAWGAVMGLVVLLCAFLIHKIPKRRKMLYILASICALMSANLFGFVIVLAGSIIGWKA